jgi:hypothetical protein
MHNVSRRPELLARATSFIEEHNHVHEKLHYILLPGTDLDWFRIEFTQEGTAEAAVVPR